MVDFSKIKPGSKIVTADGVLIGYADAIIGNSIRMRSSADVASALDLAVPPSGPSDIMTGSGAIPPDDSKH